MKLPKAKLWVKFSVSFSAVFLCLMVILSYQFLRTFSGNMRQQYIERGEKIVDTLAFNARNLVANRNIVELTNLIAGYTLSKDISFVVIYDESGKILTESGSGILSEDQVRINPEILQTKESFVRFLADVSGSPILDIFKIVKMEEKKEIEAEDILFGEESIELNPGTPENPGSEGIKGVTRVGMSLAPVNSAIRSTTLMCSKFGLFFLIGGTIVILIITRNVLRPIKALTDGARKISKGNLEQHVKVRSKDEIGELAIAFNQMSENLSTSSRTIMELNRNLERKVLERTHELESSNQELKNAYAELRSAQNQVVRSEKLASIGRLVAGVAHELNNPINFIYGNMYHLKDYVSILQQAIKTYSEVNLDQKDREKISRMREELELNYLMEDLGKLIKSVEQGAERSRVIVRDLRSFSRLDETEVREIDIHESIETTLNLLTNRYKNRIIVHRDYGEIPKMFCYADIEQVFMNLLVNAGQAIEDKGNVWISTRLQGNKVVISIRDDGVGIEREYLDKIFDPFFTTKPVGEGTGLGLSITHEIIEKHNGEISVESELGKGTTFTVKLPI